MPKQRFNSKARRRPAHHKPDAESKEEPRKAICTEISLTGMDSSMSLEKDDVRYSSVAEENPFLVCCEGRKMRIKDFSDRATVSSPTLSKKQKRRLEQFAEKKKKKSRTSDVLAAISQFQVTDKELSLYKPISSIGKKTSDVKDYNSVSNIMNCSSSAVSVNISKGKKKRKKLKLVKKMVPDVTVLNEDEIYFSSDYSSCDNESFTGDISKEEQLDKSMCWKELGKVETDTCNKTEDLQEDKTSKIESCIKDIKITSKHTGHQQQNQSSQSEGKAGTSKSDSIKQAIHVHLDRSIEVQIARHMLPILQEEQLIMETIIGNNVIIICGETGSGKTTQVPQFLYEAGFSNHSPHLGMIGVTEPRRVAAVSMSKRVSFEMNLSSSVVSYQIRYEGNTTSDTRIKFMTDGVLLKELETDFLLSKYSVIIIDEAHERSVFTDILIALLSRVVPLRNKQEKPLKLIIMSATLRVEDFLDNRKLFAVPPPLLKVDSRQFPVTVHFNRRTPANFLKEAYDKVCKIHRKLKPGGILVFVTGKNEVQSLCRQLRQTFPGKNKSPPFLEKQTNYLNQKVKTTPTYDSDRCQSLDNEDLFENFDDDFDYDDMVNESMNMDDIGFDALNDSSMPLHVLPLYSLLSTDEQAKVFEPCPEDSRLCVVATNVAETSLTIPGIKYVVDTGKVKSRFYDKLTGVSTFRITWISKASANQRAGRAGRVEPGHCYRLYSSAVFQHDFEEFSTAEICQKPADDLFLLMKSMGIDRIGNFPFPTPPDIQSLKAAESLLLDLGAVERRNTPNGSTGNTRITELGRSMARLPISPRYGKMILLAHQQDCMQYMIVIVAALTIKEVFSDDVLLDSEASEQMELDDKRKRMLVTQARRKWAGTGELSLLGDMMVILRAVGAWEFAGCTEKFCKENGIRFKAMTEIRKLRAQLIRAVNILNTGKTISPDFQIHPPTDVQARFMRQILLTCLGDRVARKVPQSDVKDIKLKNAYQSCSTDDPVFIHPQSSLFQTLPNYVVYQEIIESSKLYMKGLAVVDENWLPLFAAYKCTFSKPLESPAPRYDNKNGNVKCYMTSVYGPHSWSLSALELDYPACIDRTKWFARYLLEGKVFAMLEAFVPYLLTPPSVMVKKWSKLQPRTEVLLKDLLNENVSNRQSLLEVWTTKRNYLLESYLEWIPESMHEKMRSIWPPL